MKNPVSIFGVIALIAISFLAGQSTSASAATSSTTIIKQLQSTVGLLSARVRNLEQMLQAEPGVTYTYSTNTVNYLSATTCGSGEQVTGTSGSFRLGDKNFYSCQYIYNFQRK